MLTFDLIFFMTFTLNIQSFTEPFINIWAVGGKSWFFIIDVHK